MNREILFKAKRKNWRELPKSEWWVEGDIFRTYAKRVFIVNMSPNNAIEVDPETICQYTGLPDKNDRKIFEGDIVRRTDLHTVGQPSVGYIEYDKDNTAFLIHWADITIFSVTFPRKEKIEVIGNIFDNPQMFEIYSDPLEESPDSRENPGAGEEMG